MCSRIDLALPLPPSVNDATLNLPGRGRVKTRAYKSWEKTAGLFVIAARPSLSGNGLLTQPYGCRIRVPAAMIGDIDNRVKQILDLFVRMRLTPDDALLHHLSVGRANGIERGMCRVRVWSLAA
jgi:Holliday junction resolvase RusA-like endonuclease